MNNTSQNLEARYGVEIQYMEGRVEGRKVYGYAITKSGKPVANCYFNLSMESRHEDMAAVLKSEYPSM